MQSRSALFDASLLKFVPFGMYNYLINFRPVLLGAPLKLGALSVRLVRLWVNPALTIWAPVGRGEREQLPSPGNVPWKCFCAAKIANILQMGIMGFT